MAANDFFFPSSNPTMDIKLILPGREDGMGFLKLPLTDGSTITVQLEGRHVKVLLVLNDALKLDKDLDEAARGWMDDKLIAEAYTRGDTYTLAPTPQAIAAYRAQINRLIREATPQGFEMPRLFINKRCVGVRLIQKLVVIRLRCQCNSEGAV